MLPGLLTKESSNPLNLGLGLLKDDLTFAEDLILVCFCTLIHISV